MRPATAILPALGGIRPALDVLHEPGEVVELRILKAIKNRYTVAGWFDNLDKLARAAAPWDGKAPALYATLNPCAPALLSRAVNRLVEYAEDLTTDRDILRRRWLPIDMDPVRLKGIASTNAEHDAALARAREVRAWLTAQGWPAPILADSGNGGHLLYRIDTPNDETSRTLIQRGLAALALRFSDEAAVIDETVFNAARIWKLYGTLACKGDATPNRPHRRAALLEVPPPVEVVSQDLLEKLAALAPTPDPSHAPATGDRFDLAAWIDLRGLPVVSGGRWNGGAKWILNPCPWNADHTNRSAYIVQFATGAIAAGCHHNGCHGKGWPALRDKVEPGWREAHEEKAREKRAKAKRPEEKPKQPLPPELVGRRIHPALHFDSDGFAAVGILGGVSWRTVTSDGAEYPTEALAEILTPEPTTYPALGERWVTRAALMKREAPDPSWAEAAATALALFRDYVEHDEDPPYAVLGLWVLATYVYPTLPSFPRLNLHGEKGSGKSKTLKLIAALAHNGLWRTAPRAAPLFRLIEALRPTLCLDELEHLDREDRGDIAAILNAGYQAGGAVDRCDPMTFNVRPFAVYAPIALAGIKGLNAVLADRCITLIMQPGQDRSRVNRDVDLSNPDPRIGIVRDLCYRLALTRWREVRAAWERLNLPAWLNGRSRELWAPLLALSDVVASEASRLHLRPALLAMARPDAEDRAELPEVAAAILAALERKLGGADSGTIQPGELAEDLKATLGYEVTPTVIGLRLKALGFKRDRQRKGGSFYTIKADDIQAILERRRLAEEPIPADPPAR